MIRRLPLLFAIAACRGGEIETPAFCDVLLSCTPEVVASCTGEATPVDLPNPSVCDAADLTSDAAGAYPVGERAVTFSSVLREQQESCTTLVRVIDETPPEIDCPESVVLVRTQEGALIAAPTDVTATDTCSPGPEVTAVPPALTAPRTEVIYTATDASGNTATCATTVDVLDLFPASGLRILSASLTGDDATALTIGWEPSRGAHVAGYRVERAETASGPWSPIGQVDAAEQLFTDPSIPGSLAWYRVVPTSGDYEGPPTSPVRAFPIAADGYHERGVTVTSVPFATDLFGLVRRPSDLAAGPYPLVLLLHGNHGNCRLIGTTQDYCGGLTGHECPFSGYETAPNADGMLFQAETLAAQGMIAVTLSANALNCRNVPQSWIPQRVEYLLENLRRWKSWNDGEDGPLGTSYAGRVDLSRVGLIGHSRGGDAVANVPRRLTETPIEGVSIQSIFSIAPTDNLTARVGDAHYATLLPACDGDVSSLVGARIHDRSIDDPYDRSQVLVIGGNHNFYNTEWTFNDGNRVCPNAAVLPERPHTAMLEAMLGAWFEGTIDDRGLEPFLKAEAVTPTAIEAWAGRPLDLRWSYNAPAISLIDRFDAEGSPGVNRTGGANSFEDFVQWFGCFGRTVFSSGGCGTAFLHDKHAVYVRWDPGQSALARFDLADLDVGDHGVLSFRVASRQSPWNTGRDEQRFLIRLIDAEGRVAETVVTDVIPVRHGYVANNVREVLQTVRWSLADVLRANPELDLGALAALELDFSYDGERGTVLLTDIELAD